MLALGRGLRPSPPRRPQCPAPPNCSCPALPASAGIARMVVSRHTAAALPDERLKSARLLISELVTNAFQHGEGQIELQVHSDDDGLWAAGLRRGLRTGGPAATPRPGDGWGLNFVERLADDWGADESRVWFRLTARNFARRRYHGCVKTLALRGGADRPRWPRPPAAQTLTPSMVGEAAQRVRASSASRRRSPTRRAARACRRRRVQRADQRLRARRRLPLPVRPARARRASPGASASSAASRPTPRAASSCSTPRTTASRSFDPGGPFLARLGDSGTLQPVRPQNPDAGVGDQRRRDRGRPGGRRLRRRRRQRPRRARPVRPGQRLRHAVVQRRRWSATRRALGLDPSRHARCSSPTTTTTGSSCSTRRRSRSLAQFGSQGNGLGQFNEPYDVAVDAAGRLYVADNLNNRVDVFDAATFNPLGALRRAGRGVPGQFAIVRSVGAMADDPRGGVAAADTANDRVQTLQHRGRRDRPRGASPGRGAGLCHPPARRRLRGRRRHRGGRHVRRPGRALRRRRRLRRPVRAWSAPARASRRPATRSASTTLPSGVAYDAAATCGSPTRATTASSSSRPTASC